MHRGWGDLFTRSGLDRLWRELDTSLPLFLIAGCGVLVVESVHLLQRFSSSISHVPSWPWWWRWSAYYAVSYALVALAETGNTQFIYFQF